jgi:hypothetical protein
VIKFREEWDDPGIPGGIIKGEDFVTHVYKNEIDWRSEKSVTRLNAWRSQIIRRCVGSKYNNDKFWTIEERDVLVEIVRKHQKAGATIDWAAIAKEYNSQIEGKVQRSGCMGAERQYCVPDSKRQAFLPSLPLQQDRFVSPRTAHVLRQEMSYFRDTSAARVMAAIRNSAQLETNHELIKPKTKRQKKQEHKDQSMPKNIQQNSSLANPIARPGESKKDQNRHKDDNEPKSSVSVDLLIAKSMRVEPLPVTHPEPLPVQQAPSRSDIHCAGCKVCQK